jgi:hypothetical protein
MPTEEEKFFFPWRQHEMNERIEGHLFEVSCPMCGYSDRVEMHTEEGNQRTEFSREEVVQKFAEKHEEVRLGTNESPCTASFDSFKIENLDSKKK